MTVIYMGSVSVTYLYELDFKFKNSIYLLLCYVM